jgi:hypothetical protein
LLGVGIGNLGITIVGETNDDHSLARKLCAVNASTGMVGAYLDSSLSTLHRRQGRRLTGN